MASLSPHQLPKTSCQPNEEDTRLGRNRHSRSTRGYAPDLPADWSRPATSVELESVHKRETLAKGTDSKNPSAANAVPKPSPPCASPPTVPLEQDKVVAPRVPEAAPHRAAFMPSKDSETICTAASRRHRRYLGPRFRPDIEKSRDSEGRRFETQSGNRTWSATSSCLATAVILLPDATRKSAAPPLRNRSMLTNHETPRDATNVRSIGELTAGSDSVRE